MHPTPLACALMCASALAATPTAQATNGPLSSLIVNDNTVGSFPMPVLMGALDPNELTLGGSPNAYYVVLYGADLHPMPINGLGSLHVNLGFNFGFLSGNLDANGEANVLLSPGALMTGMSFTLQAGVADTSMGLGFRLSGASQATVVTTMAAPITLIPGVGSAAKVLGPITALGTDSVTIGNLTFEVTPATIFEVVTSLSELTVGEWIDLEAERNAAGGFDSIQIVPEDASPEVRLTGAVQSVGPAGLTLLGVSVYTTTATTYFDTLTNQASSLAGVVNGMVVEVRIPAQEMFPSVNSMEMNVEPEPEPEPEDEIEVEDEDPPPPSFCS